MNDPVMNEVTRRDLLAGAALLGAAAILSGCQPGSTSARLPGPVWPDDDATEGGYDGPNSPNSRRNATIGSPQPTTQPTVVSVPSGVISRSTWTNTQPRWNQSLPMNGVQLITVHHTAINSSGLWKQSEVARTIANMRQSHLRRGAEWIDIGYHYLIDPSGRVWQGRPTSIEGAHVAKTNPHNLGIVLLGNFDEQRPTAEQISALDGFVASQMRQYRVPVGRVYTHQELKASACPGRNLQRYMQQTRARGGRLATT